MVDAGLDGYTTIEETAADYYMQILPKFHNEIAITLAVSKILELLSILYDNDHIREVIRRVTIVIDDAEQESSAKRQDTKGPGFDTSHEPRTSKKRSPK